MPTKLAQKERLAAILKQLPSNVRKAGFKFQNFSPSEQQCISKEVSRAVGEGIKQNQAIAKAIGI